MPDRILRRHNGSTRLSQDEPGAGQSTNDKDSASVATSLESPTTPTSTISLPPGEERKALSNEGVRKIVQKVNNKKSSTCNIL